MPAAGRTAIPKSPIQIRRFRITGGGIVNTYNIERPAPLDFSVQVTIRKTPATPATIVSDITAAVLANFIGEAGVDRVRLASACYASRFFSAVASVGVQNLVSVKISIDGGLSWLDEITVNADQMPVLSADNVSVVVLTS